MQTINTRKITMTSQQQKNTINNRKTLEDKKNILK